MSGHEINVVALASTPIIANALSGFTQEARIYKIWRRERCLHETLEVLLANIVESESDLY